jgi:hypothetical protein
MAECKYCGLETTLFSGGVPICDACADDIDDGYTPPYNRKQKPLSIEQAEPNGMS